MKRFVTEYTGEDGHQYSGLVDAVDKEQAQQLCDERGRGEQVLGTLMLVISGPVLEEKVIEMTKALAEGLDQEPPDAEEFDRHGDNGC